MILFPYPYQILEQVEPFKKKSLDAHKYLLNDLINYCK
jgi:hypothetical protein